MLSFLGDSGPSDALGDGGPGDDGASGDVGDTDADIGILFQSLLAVTAALYVMMV